MKRFLSITVLICTLFLLCSCDFGKNYVAQGTYGENLKWTLDNDGTLTVKGNGMMMDYSYSREIPWYDIKQNIKSVVIKNGVTSISSYAFSDCSSLTDVTIPQSVISIGSSAFRSCKSLTSINIPEGLTEINEGIFLDSGLKSIKIPNSVTKIGDAAFYCRNLTEIYIPASVKEMSNEIFGNLLSYLILENIYYSGSEVQWNSISKGKRIPPEANIHFNSQW